MAERIRYRPCPTCGNVLAKQDLSNGTVVLVGSRKFKHQNGTILVWCKACNKYVGLDAWNPLGG